MAGSSLLVLLDDIAVLLDDIAVMGKLAVKKTAGVLGDDLSLNAQQVSGVRANRELPVIWQVTKGSFINKLILVPLALIISALAPWAVMPLLMAGGAFLCFEGVEKVVHSFQAAKHKESDEERQKRLADIAQIDPMVYEKDKIKGAIRTDFILSAEIVTITLGIVAAEPLLNQIMVLAGIAIIATVGVYGLVAMIVKLDDLGFWLVERQNILARGLGKFLLLLAPILMKVLSFVGTLAMFLVGGGILVHGIPALHHAVVEWSEKMGGFVNFFAPQLVNLVIGFAIGAIALMLVNGVKRLRGSS